MAFDDAKLVWELTWDADWVTAVSFVGNSRRLVAGNRLGELLQWDLPEDLEVDPPSPIVQLRGHDNAITRLCGTRDGKFLYSSSFDHTIRRWDMDADTKGEQDVTLNARAIYNESLKRNGGKPPKPDTCAVSLHTACELIDGPPSQKLRRTGHTEWINAMSLSQDESLLVSGDDAGLVIMRDRATGKESHRWKVEGWVHALALSPDNQRALISERRPLVFDSGKHQAVKLWDATKGELVADLSEQFKKMYIAAAAYSPDGKTLVVGRGEEQEGKVFMLNPENGEKTKELNPVHQYGVTDFAFHPDGKHFLSAGRDTVIRIWNIESGEQVKALGKPRGGQFKDWIHAIALNHDASLLAAADMAGQVNVWRL